MNELIVEDNQVSIVATSVEMDVITVGEVGPTGPAGATGATGPQGPQGPAGSSTDLTATFLLMGG